MLTSLLVTNQGKCNKVRVGTEQESEAEKKGCLVERLEIYDFLMMDIAGVCTL